MWVFVSLYNSMHRHGFRLLLVAACLVATVAVAAPDPFDGRPSILDTKKEASPAYGSWARLQPQLELLERCVRKLLPLLAEFEMFSLSRDTDTLYDALVTALDDHPRGAELLSRVKRVIYSSGVSGTAYSQQRAWMSHYNLTARALAEGSLRAMILDIGWRGSQPSAMLFALLDEIADSGTVDEAKAVLRNFDVRLIGPSDEESYDAVRARVLERSFDSAEEVSNFVRRSSLRYKGILDDEQPRRVSYNAGTSLKASRKNWAPTAYTLSGDGRSIVWDNHDSTIDQEAMVRWQQELARHFRTDEVKASFAPLINEVLQKLKKDERLKATEVPEDVVPATLRGHARVPTFAPEGVHSFLIEPSGSFPYVRRFTVRASNEAEAQEAVRAQHRRLERLREMGAPVIASEWSDEALVQSLPPGRSGVQWLAQWVGDGRPASDPAVASLADLFTTLAAGNVYPRGLDPASLWLEDSGAWRIVGAGGTLALSGPALAMRLLRTVHLRWDTHLAEHLTPSFPALASGAHFPALADASPEMLAELHPVFRRSDGQLFQVDTRVSAKDETAIFTGFGSDGKEYLLKIARGDAGRARLQKQREGDATLVAAGLPVTTPVELGSTYRLVAKVQGVTAKRWLEQFPTVEHEAVAPLGALVNQLVDAGVFVSGLWPSHLLFENGRWHLVGHHGVRPEPDAEKLRGEYRDRFAQRWTTPLAPTCGEKIVRSLFVPTVSL